MFIGSSADKLYLAMEEFRQHRKLIFGPASEGHYYFTTFEKRTCYVDKTMIGLFAEKVRAAFPCAEIIEKKSGRKWIFKNEGSLTGVRNLTNTPFAALFQEALKVLIADRELMVFENLPRLKKMNPSYTVIPPHEGISGLWFYDLYGNVCQWDEKIEEKFQAFFLSDDSENTLSVSTMKIMVDLISGIELSPDDSPKSLSHSALVKEGGRRFEVKHQCPRSTHLDELL